MENVNKIANNFNVVINSTDTNIKITCIEKTEKEDIWYEKIFTNDDVKGFSTGNLANFIKICNEVFTDSTKKHSVLFDSNSTGQQNVNIKILYSSFFDFELDLNLPFSHKILKQVQITHTLDIGNNNNNKPTTEINNEVQNIKLVIGSLVENNKSISNEVVILKNNMIEAKTVINNLANALTTVTSNVQNISQNVVQNNDQNNNMDNITMTIKHLFNSLNKLEKFIFSEITHVKITADDNDEKIPIKCPNLTVNYMDCMCSTVNKYMFYNDEPNYIISTNKKTNFSDSLKLVQCKNLFISTQIFTDGIKLTNLPPAENLTITSKGDFIDFAFIATLDQMSIKNLTIQHISKFKNFDTMIKHVNPQILGISNSESVIKETNFESLGYQYKETVKNDNNFTSLNTAIYIKLPDSNQNQVQTNQTSNQDNVN